MCEIESSPKFMPQTAQLETHNLASRDFWTLVVTSIHTCRLGFFGAYDEVLSRYGGSNIYL